MNKKGFSIFFIIVFCASVLVNFFFLIGSDILPKEYLLRIKSNSEIKNVNIAGISYGDIDNRINYTTGYRPLDDAKIEILNHGWFVQFLKGVIAKVIGERTQKLTMVIENEDFFKLENLTDNLEKEENTNNFQKDSKIKEDKNNKKKYFIIQLNNKKINLSIEYDK